MKRWISVMIVCGELILGVPALHAQQGVPATAAESAEVNGLVIPFTDALKAGDVSALKGLLSEGMYREYRRLFEENKDYPAFLVRYYEGVDIKLVDVIKNDDGLCARVRLDFANGETSVLRISMKEEGNPGALRIGRVLTESKGAKAGSQ